MDAIDILGGLLGRKSSGSGKGPDILKDILGRGRRSSPPESTATEPTSIERQARELEDILNVSHERDEARRTGPSPPPRAPQRAPADTGVPVDSPFAEPREQRRPPSRQAESLPQNEQALFLVRAMVNAAKADGQISPGEQQAIVERLGGASPDAVRFLREELSKPLDIREFAWSVPIGMEQQVFAMSLIAIDVDSRAETAYLDELAHALRLPAEARDRLRRRYTA